MLKIDREEQFLTLVKTLTIRTLEDIKGLAESFKKYDYENDKYCMSLPLKIRCYSYLGRSYLLSKEPEFALENQGKRI